MTIDDGTGVTITCAVVAALASAVAWLWKAMDKRYQAELAKRDVIIEDLTKRIRAVEDARVPTHEAHAAKMEALTDRYDATANRMAEAMNSVAKAVREIAQNSNTQTEAIKGMRCRLTDLPDLPDPHPAGKGTGPITAKNRDHA